MKHRDIFNKNDLSVSSHSPRGTCPISKGTMENITFLLNCTFEFIVRKENQQDATI